MSTQKMSPELVELYWRVINNVEQVIPIIYFLDQFKRRDEMLSWLIQQNITGMEFLAWFRYICNGSQKKMAQIILKNINNDLELKEIFFGKDVEES